MIDDLVKSHQSGWQSKKLQMQGAQFLRSEAYLAYAATTKDAVQRRRWTFYEAIMIDKLNGGTTG